MLGQRVPNEQSNVGPTKYVAVGLTLNQRLGFGWRMVIVLAGMELTLFGDTVFRADSLTYFLFLYIYTLFVTGKRKPYV